MSQDRNFHLVGTLESQLECVVSTLDILF